MLSILKVSFITFITKSAIDVLMQWMLSSIEVREHIWGKFTRSIGYIWYDFILHFWAYIIIAFIFYFILSYPKKVDPRIIYIGFAIIIIVLLLNLHQFQFPMKQYHFPSKQVFNYKLLEEVIVYLSSLFVMIYFIKKLVSKKQPN